ncbi:ABC transporter substrate-binding protein [Paenibacillus tyrfis]|uniref:ABC transporter substrate-binding protein n=1 Tax=Paenibacillus tyrfis TaxID=1501230 RepID=UPI000B58DD2A|nr:ABC transporter substrate-binding protein [Paenibacillus tyrfis]
MRDMLHRLRLAGRMPLSVLLCLVVAGGLLAGCGTANNGAAPVPGANTDEKSAAADGQSQAPAKEQVVKDELGHEVKVPAAPKRVFAPYLEDSLLKLGIKPVAQWSSGTQGQDYLQQELSGVPRLDFSGGPPSPEVLMAYNPDLIILQNNSYSGNGNYEKYAKVAPTYAFTNASGDVEKSLATLGSLLGKSAEAEQALKAYRQKVQEAKEKLDQAAKGKKVAVIRFAARGVSLMGGNYMSGQVLYQKLGLGKPKLVEKENSASISLEILPQLDADYIFIINQYGQGTERIKEITGSPIWKAMPAAKQGQVFEVSDNYWLGNGLIAYEKIIDDTVKHLVK